MACITPTHLYRKYLVWKIIRKKVPKNFYFLEIGCGTGDFSFELASYGLAGTAIDISEEAIRLAKKKLKNEDIKVVRGDFSEFEPRDNLDAIFMFEVLEHVENDQEILKKIFNLLEPQGVFLFSVPAHEKLWGRDDEWGGHYLRYARKDLIRLLSDIGFTVEVFWCYGFPIFNLTRWVYNFLCKFKKKEKTEITNIEKKEITGVDKEGADLVKKISWFYPYLSPIFRFCDLFLNFDLGVGYICYCRKKKK